MSDPIPWAIDDLIICDNHDWRSTFLDAFGLAAVAVIQNARTNRWPLLGGVTRAQRKLTLRTLFGQRDFDDREAARLLLMQNMNYETETVHRLVASDWPIYDAAPDHVVLACGPMDVYNSASTWYVQDLMQRNIGTLGGGWWTEPDSGIQIAEAATNMVKNPSAEAAGNFAAAGAASATVSTTYVYRGGYSFLLITTAAANDGITFTLSALSNATHYVTLRTHEAWTTQEWSLDNANWNAPTLLGTDGDWNIYGYSFLAGQANGSTTLRIRQSDATLRSVYIDAVQVEATAYPTPYLDGSLGFGHSFSGTAHASTSARTAGTLKFPNPIALAAGSVTLTWTPVADNTCTTTRYLFSEGNLKAYFNPADDKLYFTDGTNTISTAALTFNGLTAQRLVFTWSSAGLKIYRNGALAASGATYTAVTSVGTYIYIGSDSLGANQASGWIDDLLIFDTEALATTIYFLGDGKTLGRARWIDILCESVQATDARDYGLVSTLDIDDDIRWRSRDGDVAFWRVYDDTGTIKIENRGDDDAYPIYHLTTRTAKTGGVAYSRYIFLVWKGTSAATRYPVRITLPDLTGKAQADGDDIRVIVDGTEVDRWLDGTIAGYNVWVNLNFSAAPSAVTLASQMLIGDTVTTITCACSVSDWPSTGTVLIDSEAFTYTGKTSTTSGHHTNQILTGVTRAAKGTAAAGHAAATPIYLVQRDIVITYGDATLTAPTVDANYKPAFELDHSTNTSWVYEVFGDDAGKRTGAWSFHCDEGVATATTANHGTMATPWTDIGVASTAKRHGTGNWKLYNPCGLTNINVTNGEYYGQLHLNDPEIEIYSSINGSSWVHVYVLTPTCDATWRAWSQNVALTTGAKFVRVEVEINGYECGYGSNQLWGEFADATVTLNSSYTPTITIGSEASSGAIFGPVITNATTGESITLSAALRIDITLTIDTSNKTLTLSDGSSRLDMLGLDSTRCEWLRLLPGLNTLTFDDVGTEKLEIEIEWDRRYFE
jgi:hypothetical protein